MTSIYSAPSLAEVIRQLMIYRLTGVLMIRRAAGPRSEEASLAIVQGQPARVRWGTYEDNANESLLRWMNGWGEIHFIFYAREAQRQLPPSRQNQSKLQNTQHPSQFSSSSSVTRPLPKMQKNGTAAPITGMPVRGESREAQTVYEGTGSYTVSSQNTIKQLPEEPQIVRDMPRTTTETNIPLLTENARNFPIKNLTRYDRTIFLLINDRRTIADLIQLTHRSLTEVYTSLYRLRDLQLIEFWS
ncbi:MAG TPA: hypothetical protein VF043_38375 [Ktedonobacteraceae bacterium]